MGVEARSRLCPRPLRKTVLLLFVWPPLFPWQLPLSPDVSEEDLHGGVSFWEWGGRRERMILTSPSLETSQVSTSSIISWEMPN